MAKRVEKDLCLGSIKPINYLICPLNCFYLASHSNLKTHYMKKLVLSIATTATLLFGINKANAQAGAALNFDGTSNDQINMGTSMTTAMGTFSVLTVEAWVNPATISSSNYGEIIGNYNSPSGSQLQFLLRQQQDAYAFYVDAGSGLQGTNTPAGTATANVWQHVVGVWDGNNVLIYVNGVLQATQTGVTGPNLNNTVTNSVVMGYEPAGSGEGFIGNMDEVRIWSSVRTQCQINNSMNCELATTDRAGLFAYYKFNEGVAGGSNSTITTLDDSSGNAYNGTLNAFALTGTSGNWVAPGGVTTGVSCGPIVNPTTTITATSNTVCAGTPVTLTATTTGGVSPYMYTWHPGGTSGSSPTLTNTTTITPSATSTVTAVKKWWALVTDANGCAFTNDTVPVLVNSLPTASTSITSTVGCAGTAFTLTAVPTGGGLAPLSYTWHPGGTSPTGTVTTITPSATTATSVKKWFMTVQDANGCVFTNDTVAVQINALPTVSVTINTATVCAGTMDTLTASGTITSYTWNTSATTASITPSPTVTSTYTVMGTDVNGCMNMATATINVNALPTLSVTATAGFSVCPNTRDTLKASGTATSYTWNTTHVVTDYTVHPNFTTTYTLTGVDANGCTNTMTQVITVYPRPTLTVTATSGTVCVGNSTTLSTTTGSVTVTSYSWSTGATTPTISVSPVLTSTYSVEGFSSEGCATTKHYTVTVNPLPTVTAISTEDSICVGGTDSLIASGASTYTWNTSETDPEILVTLTVTTTFTVMGTDGNGCENMATVTQSVSTTCYAGIERVEGNNNEVTVYPNPSNGNFVITIAENATFILITDILGNELVSINPKGKTTNNINLSTQSSGVYFIKVTANGTQTVKRIVINN
jgi:concanavalin A-like lectin/glucanase superfamily protein/type IX secretion system substrate protein